MGKGVMALLSSISQFNLLSSRNDIKSKPVQKYYQIIEEILKLLRPVYDEVVRSEIVSDEQLEKALDDLDAAVNEAMELMESCHQMMSRIYFVFQVESLITKIQTSGLVTCRRMSSLLHSLTVDSNLFSCIEQCGQKIQEIEAEKILDVIKEAIRNQEENTVPSSDSLVKISDTLSLNSNQELLMEAVALEKLKLKADHDENIGEAKYIDHIISLVTNMQESLVKLKQLQSVNGVSIPADFCCPLSLELMSDPVMVASGQTYERAFIRKWLDQGLTVCPKTRQTLSLTNLIPNYNVKALIANWCELNNVKLPDPIKSMSLNQPSTFLAQANVGTGDAHNLPIRPRSPESIRRLMGSHKGVFLSNGSHQNDKPTSPSHLRIATESSVISGLPMEPLLHIGNGYEETISRVSSISSEDRETNLEDQIVGSSGQSSIPLRKDFSEATSVDEQCLGHSRSASASSAVSSSDYQQGMGDANDVLRVSSDLTHYGSDASGEVSTEAQASSASHGDPEFPPKFAEVRSRSQTIWRRPFERFVSRVASSPAMDTRSDHSGIETQVQKLIKDLQSTSVDVQRVAAAELRLLAKHNMENRIVIANCGAISLLVGLLHSTDLKTQENAVTALLNLSINDNNKTAIADADSINPLIHVLQMGNPEAKENAAATLFSLSVIEENKVRIGRSGAIGPLVELLGNGTPRGKKDAATALFNLSIFPENKARIVQAGAVRHLVELMDPAAGMVDKAVAVLANLATIPEGRSAIGLEGGIPVLVEVVELGSARGKENAAAALLHLCTTNNRFSSMVLQEGAVPPLVALSQSGTPRAKEKAQALLSYFRNQRHGHGHGNAGRN